MRVVRHETATGFLERAGAWLGRAGTENHLIHGLCSELAADAAAPDANLWLLTVEAGDSLVGAAMMTPTRNLLITRMGERALGVLADFLQTEQASLPGVAGPVPEVVSFAQNWSQRTGRKPVLHMDQLIHECRSVRPIHFAEGRLRVVDIADRERLLDWCRKFLIEVGEPVERADGIVEVVLARRRAYYWDVDRPVCCATAIRETATGIAIALVYTPPELRGHGYATSCVAALTERQLAAGKAVCWLYTDRTNPTPNKIYAKIGYEPVCAAQVWEFA